MFKRAETLAQAGKYLAALASDLPERNGWAIAWFCGDRTPDKTQRLLNHAAWDASAAMSTVRRFGAAGLEAARRHGKRKGRLEILALDETGQEKAGVLNARTVSWLRPSQIQAIFPVTWSVTTVRNLSLPLPQDFLSMPIIVRSPGRPRVAAASAETRATMLTTASQVMRSSAETFVHAICAAIQAACSSNGMVNRSS